jgi:hypothetical protein
LAAPAVVVLDDRLLVEELLVGLPRRRRRLSLYTTMYWYYRACRAATAGAGYDRVEVRGTAGARPIRVWSSRRNSSTCIVLDLRKRIAEGYVKPRKGGVQRGLHGADRAAHRCCHFVEAEIKSIPQDNRQPLSICELVDRDTERFVVRHEFSNVVH